MEDIKKQTLVIEVTDQDIEKFRKAINSFRGNYSNTDNKYFFVVTELKSENPKGIIFAITSENEYVFYKIGFNFGTIKQFSGK